MPGIPQVWYLDLFAGKNDYAAADKGGTASHKEINRTTLSNEMIAAGLQNSVVLDQLEMMRLRNTSAAFNGTLHIADSPMNEMELAWSQGDDRITLKANLNSHEFTISHHPSGGKAQLYTYPKR